MGGQEAIRKEWHEYYHDDTKGLIFVVDSADPTHFDEASAELAHLLVQAQLKNVALLVFANKQDLAGAASVGELSEKLQLNSILNRPWHLQSSCAKTGTGLQEGLEWMSNALVKN